MPDEINDRSVVYFQDGPIRRTLYVQSVHEWKDALVCSYGSNSRITVTKSQVRLRSVVDAEEKAAREAELKTKREANEAGQLAQIVTAWNAGAKTFAAMGDYIKISPATASKRFRLAIARGLIVKESSLQNQKQSSPSPQ